MGKYKKNKKKHNNKGGMNRFKVAPKIYTNYFGENVEVVDPKGEILKENEKIMLIEGREPIRCDRHISYEDIKKLDAMDILCEKAMRSIL